MFIIVDIKYRVILNINYAQQLSVLMARSAKSEHAVDETGARESYRPDTYLLWGMI